MKIKSWLALGLFSLSTPLQADLIKTAGGNHNPNFTIAVTCEGSTVENAKKECLQTAIERAVGTLIVTDIESSDDRLTSENIVRYSAGYINDYKITKHYQNEVGWWNLEMDVEVASSKIGKRNTSRGKDTNLIRGDVESTVLQSKLDQRQSGDDLIARLLMSYPQSAYTLNSGQTEFSIGNSRRSYIDIPYKIVMSEDWVAALDEAFKLVSVDSNKCNNFTKAVFNDSDFKSQTGQGVQKIVGKICGSEPDVTVASRGMFSNTRSYYFADSQTLQMINSQIRTNGRQHIALQVDLLDHSGNTIDQRCTPIDNSNLISYERPRGTYNVRDKYTSGRPTFHSGNDAYGTVRINLHKPVKKWYGDLAKVSLSIQKSCY